MSGQGIDQSVYREGLRWGKKILIIEDEALSAMLLARTLSDIGYSIDKVVATGEAAIENAKLGNPDIIAMDIRLAGKLDGIEAASTITSELSIPIVFMPGYDDRLTRDRAMSLKPLGYMIKPLDLKKI